MFKFEFVEYMVQEKHESHSDPEYLRTLPSSDSEHFPQTQNTSSDLEHFVKNLSGPRTISLT